MQQQTQVWEALVGNAMTFSAYIEEPPVDPAHSGSGTPITGAAVYLSIYESDGGPLSGQLWPVLMIEVGSPGWYSSTLPSTLNWQHMTAYRGQIDYADEVKAVPPIVAYDRTLQQPTQAALRAIAKEAGLSI